MDAVPVIARGHNLAIFVPPVPAAAAPCLQAIPESRPAIVLTADSDRAVALADACRRPALDTLAVSGLARAERRLKGAQPALLFVAAADALQLLKRSQLRCAELQTVVLAWPEQLDDEGREALGAELSGGQSIDPASKTQPGKACFLSQPIRFHTDEHIGWAVIEGLRRRGIDVSTTSETGLQSATDVEQLNYAYEAG